MAWACNFFTDSGTSSMKMVVEERFTLLMPFDTNLNYILMMRMLGLVYLYLIMMVNSYFYVDYQRTLL